MAERNAIDRLPTHDVENQPGELPDYDAWSTDAPLRAAVTELAPAWVADYLAGIGVETGRAHWFEQGFLANRNPPELAAFDRFGRRIDEVRYHPAYHAFMDLAISRGVHAVAWERAGEGGHAAHVAALYLLTQPEQGFLCPIVMTHSSIPALRMAPEVAREWEPRVLSHVYDPRSLPAGGKTGATIGMAMTEKQGGSDVRANTTRATPATDGGYELVGHKWFCSAPMSDAFLTLGQLDGGLTCFLVPRWRPDGARNRVFIQRLKDKCGNRSNASGEIEYHGAWAERVGGSGRGVRTIIEMVQQTRLDAATAPVGMMRQALVQALHHCRHRRAFGEQLIDQPLMRTVLADLAVEVEACTWFALRVASAFDRGHDDLQERLFARIATAVLKYWTNKRAPQLIYEAMECLGGGGYVEESLLPRLYREAPVNSIWEGSGNVICLDVLRAMEREPETVPAVLREAEAARGSDRRLDATLDRLRGELTAGEDAQSRARRLVERLATALQASLLVRHAPAAVADAYCATRLGADGGFNYGTLPPGCDVDAILSRAWQAD